LDVDGDETSGDGLVFIEIGSGETVLAARLEDGWMLESADGSEGSSPTPSLSRGSGFARAERRKAGNRDCGADS
jgi:hypothetical protein